MLPDVRLIEPESVHARTLSNGLRVLIRRESSAPVAAIVTYVRAGYFDETDDIAGISHVLEHMYFKGTPTRGVGEIARQTKAAGGYLNAATIYDHTLYYAVVPASGFSAALDVQADAYRNSLIDANELGKELEVIIQEAKRKADNPSAVAIETLYAVLHDRHRIRRWRIGHEDGLRRLNRDHLTGFYRNFYRPSATILCVVADVEPDAAFAEVERLYGDLPAGEPARAPGPGEDADPGFRYRELSGDVAQTQIAFGWRSPGALHPDTPALDLLATAVGAGRASRLYRAVRERKLASAVTAYNYTPHEIGVFVVHAEAPPDAAADAADAIWDQMRHVRNDGFGALELERAKRITESRWIRRLEDAEGQANYLAEWESLGDWRLGDRYLERILTLSADDLRRVAKSYLREEHASLLLYRPETSPQIANSAEVMRLRLERALCEPIDVPAAAERAIAIPAVHKPAFERAEAGVHVYRLPSGLPILVKQKRGSPIVYAGLFALGGASAENAEIGGRSLLMARSAIKGTKRRTALQIAEDSELLGGSVVPSVGGDSLGWSISVPARHAAAALELLADVAQQPVFDEQTVETERAIALADLASLHDDMYRYPMRLATEAAFRGHAYGVPLLGTETSLRVHTRDDLAAWHQDEVLAASTVVGLIGDAGPDELAEIAARHFRDLTWRPPDSLATPVWPQFFTESVEHREKAQTALVMLFPSPSRSDARRFDVAMLSGVASGLGGRLFEELRDKQSLCYTVHAFANERRVTGWFAAYVATSPEQESVARDALLRELEKFRGEPVTDQELKRAQTYAIGVHAIRQQNGGSVLGEMIDAWMFGELRELEEHEGRVRAVTAERVQEIAQRCFDPDRRVEGIVRGVGKQV